MQSTKTQIHDGKGVYNDRKQIARIWVGEELSHLFNIRRDKKENERGTNDDSRAIGKPASRLNLCLIMLCFSCDFYKRHAANYGKDLLTSNVSSSR